ncbi:hypothetical protein [Alkalibaculum bacchi]|uniref:hypothetical protein n=1 Tax=Alkalibaculum bacchi TaxID=645887 RepID=UPI0026EE2E47|nr:hypothetical protein [Alkalibaculum bacchi]
MNHKMKVFFFFLFTLCVLYMGVREVNYSNYEIVENGTREVITYRIDEEGTELNVFGENLYIDRSTIESIKDTITSVIPKQ